MLDYQYFNDAYNEYPLLIRIIWVLSGMLLFAIIGLSTYLKLIRNRLRKNSENRTKLRKEYETLLVEYLYSGDETGKLSVNQEAIMLQLKHAISISFNRKIIVKLLYNLMNEVSGEMSDSIKTLYEETGLLKHAVSRLKNKNWYVIAKGIGELTRFDISDVHQSVSKFINHPRHEVRKETQLYMVTMFRFQGLSFLDDLKTTLSEWDQVQLLEVLQKLEDQEICDIKPWLKSTNDSVVLFALKLSQIYNQFEVKDTLMDLLTHSSKIIRVNVIEVLTHLYGIEAKDKLKANFEELSIEEQISFFGLLEKLVIPSDEPFIEEHLFHKNFEIQLLALKILKSINIDKYIGLDKLPEEEKSEAMLKTVNSI